MNYDSFEFIFPFISIILFTLANGVYWLFYQLDFSTSTNFLSDSTIQKQNEPHDGLVSIYLQNKSRNLVQELFLFFSIKSLISAIIFSVFHSILLEIIIDLSILTIFILGFSIFYPKMKAKYQNEEHQKHHLPFIFLDFIKITLLILPFIGLVPQFRYLKQSFALILPFSVFMLIKITCVLLLKFREIRLKYFLPIIAKTFLQEISMAISLISSMIIFIIGIISTSDRILTLILLTTIFFEGLCEYAIFKIPTKKIDLQNQFLFFIVNVFLSFIIIPTSWYFQLLIFTILALVAGKFLKMHDERLQKYHRHLQTIMFLILMVEIGLSLAIFSTANDWLINSFPFINYIFFLNISLLSIFIHLQNVEYNRKPPKSLTVSILGSLLILQLGLFLLLIGGIHQITSIFLDLSRQSFIFQLIFQKEGLLDLTNTNNFIGAIGNWTSQFHLLFRSNLLFNELLSLSLSAITCIFFFNLIVQINGKFGFLPRSLPRKIQFFENLVIIQIISLIPFFYCPSLTSFIIGKYLRNFLMIKFSKRWINEFTKENESALKITLISFFKLGNNLMLLPLTTFLLSEFFEMNLVLSLFIGILIGFFAYNYFEPIIKLPILQKTWKKVKIFDIGRICYHFLMILVFSVYGILIIRMLIIQYLEPTFGFLLSILILGITLRMNLRFLKTPLEILNNNKIISDEKYVRTKFSSWIFSNFIGCVNIGIFLQIILFSSIRTYILANKIYGTIVFEFLLPIILYVFISFHFGKQYNNFLLHKKYQKKTKAFSLFSELLLILVICLIIEFFLYNYIFGIFFSTAVFMSIMYFHCKKFLIIYPNKEKLIEQIKCTIKLVNSLMISLVIAFFIQEFLPSSPFLLIFISSFLTLIIFGIFQRKQPILAENIAAIGKSLILLINALSTLGIFFFSKFWDFSSISANYKIIFISMACNYIISVIIYGIIQFNKYNLLSKQSLPMILLIPTQLGFFTLYIFLLGFFGMIIAGFSLIGFSLSLGAEIALKGFLPSLFLSFISRNLSKFKVFKPLQRYSTIFKYQTVIWWNIFAFSQALMLILINPSKPFLILLAIIFFTSTIIQTTKDLAKIYEKITHKAKFIIDMLLIINIIFSASFIFVLCRINFNLSLILTTLIVSIYSTIMFSRVNLFSHYIFPTVYQIVKLILLNTIFVSFFIFCAQLAQIYFIDENSIVEQRIYLYYSILLGFQYFIPLFKHNIRILKEINIIPVRFWESIHFGLLHFQFYSMILAELMLLSHISGFYSFSLMKSMINPTYWLFLVPSTMILPGILLYLNSKNSKFDQKTQFQHAFLVEFYMYFLSIVISIGIGNILITEFRWELLIGIISVIKLYLVFTLIRINHILLKLEKILNPVILALKRLILLEIGGFLVTLLHYQFAVRWITAGFFGLVLLNALVLSISFFKDCIPVSLWNEFLGFIVLCTGWTLFAVLIHFSLPLENQISYLLFTSILIAPLSLTYLALLIIRNGKIPTKITFHLLQVVFFLINTDLMFVVYTGINQIISPVFFLIPMVFILNSAIFYDKKHLMLFMNRKLELITSSLVFVFSYCSLSIFISDLIAFNLETQIFVFCLAILPGIYLGLKLTEKNYAKYIDLYVLTKEKQKTKTSHDFALIEDRVVEKGVTREELLEEKQDTELSKELETGKKQEFEQKQEVKFNSKQEFQKIPLGFSIIDYLHRKYTLFFKSWMIFAGLLLSYFWIRLAWLNHISLVFTISASLLGLIFVSKSIYKEDFRLLTFYSIIIGNILYYLIIAYIQPQNLTISLILSIIILGVFHRLTTSLLPQPKELLNLENILILSLYWSALSILPWNISLIILMITSVFLILSPRSYLNLFFVTVFVGSIIFFFYTLMTYYDISWYLSLTGSITIGVFGEWILCGISIRWRKSLLKTLLGYLAYSISLLSFGSLLYDYFYFMRYIAPVVFGVILGLVYLLQKATQSPRQKIFFTVLIFAHTFLLFLSIGYCYLFYSLAYLIPLSITLGIGLTLLMYFFFFEHFNLPINPNMVKATLFLAGTGFSLNILLLLIEPTLIQLALKIAIPIALDFYIFIYFIGVGLYLKQFTKEIWNKGAYAWLFVPIVNFVLILEAVTNIDEYTLAIQLSKISLSGSIVLSILISSLLYLPYLLTKLKKFIDYFVYVFWTELLLLVYWASANIFPINFLLQIPFVGLITIAVIIPYYYFRKRWNLLLYLWPVACALNIVFFSLYFTFGLQWEVPLNFFIGALYLVIYANFPPIKEKIPILKLVFTISSYLILFGSLFALLYSFIVIIFYDWVISASISLIIMSFALIPGRFFQIDKKILKPIFSIFLAIGTGLVIWRTFSLIQAADFNLFGVFLGIAFFWALMLLFQVKEYLLSKFYQISWGFMALSFGLAAFEIFLTVFRVGEWASTGVLILVATFITFPLSKKHLVLPFSFICIAIALILNQAIIIIWNLAKVQPALTFVHLTLTLFWGLSFLGYKMIRFGIFANKMKNFLVYLDIWGLFIITTSVNIVLSINLMIPLDWYNFGGILCNLLLFFSVATAYALKSNDIILDSTNLQKILSIFRNYLIVGLYLINSLLISLNAPVLLLNESEILGIVLYRASIFFATLYLVILVLDKYIIKALERKIQKEILWVLVLGFSLFISAYSFISWQTWQLSLLIFASLSIYTLFLVSRVHRLKFHMSLVITDIFLLNVSLFWVLFISFDITKVVHERTGYYILLIGSITALIDYLLVRIKVIPQKSRVYFAVQLNVILAAFACEAFRLQFNQSYSDILGLANILAVFVGTLIVTNIKLIKRNELVLAFWMSFSYAIGMLIFNSAKILLNSFGLTFHIPEAILFFVGILFFIFHIFLSSLMKNIIIFTTNDDFQKKDDNSPVLSSFSRIKMKTANYKSIKHWIIPKLSFNFPQDALNMELSYKISQVILLGGVVTAVNHFWNKIFVLIFNQGQISLAFQIILWFLSFMVFITFGWLYILNNFDKNNLTLQFKLNFLKNKALIRAISIYLCSVSLFFHLWPILNLSEYIGTLKFDRLFLDLLIVNLFLLVSKKSLHIAQKIFQYFKLSATLLFSCYIFEVLRIFTQIPLFLNVALVFFVFAVLNIQNITNILHVYLFWAFFTNLISSLVYLFISTFIIHLESLFNIIITNLFIFGIVFTFITGLITEIEIHNRDKIALSLRESSMASRIKKSIPQILSIGSKDESQRKAAYVIWLSLFSIIFTIFLSRIAYFVIWNEFVWKDNSQVFRIILLAITIPLLFNLYSFIVRGYINKTGFKWNWLSFLNQIDSFWNYITTVNLSLWIFVICWNQFDIISFIRDSATLYPLLGNFLLSIGILYISFYNKRIPSYGKKYLRYFWKICFTVFIEECLRYFFNFNYGLILSVPVLIFTYIFINEANSQISSGILWSTRQLSVFGIIISFIFYIFEDKDLLSQIFLATFIFSVIFSVVLLIRDKELIEVDFEPESDQNREILKRSNKSENVAKENIPYSKKIFDSLRSFQLITAVWILLFPVCFFGIILLSIYRFLNPPFYTDFPAIFSTISIVIISFTTVYIYSIFLIVFGKYVNKHKLSELMGKNKCISQNLLRILSLVVYTAFTAVETAFLMLFFYSLPLVEQIGFVSLLLSISLILVLKIGELKINKILDVRKVELSIFMLFLIVGASGATLLIYTTDQWNIIGVLFIYLAILKRSRYVPKRWYIYLYRASILGIYLTVLIQVGMLLWSVLNPYISILIIMGLLHLVVEFEVWRNFLEIDHKRLLTKQISWILFNLTSITCGLILIIPVITTYYIFTLFLIVIAELFYTLFLFFDPATNLYKIIKSILVYATYLIILVLTCNILVILNLKTLSGYFDSLILTRMVLVTEILLVIYLIIMIDKRIVHEINQRFISRAELTSFIVFIISCASNLGYLIYLIIPAPTPAPTPTQINYQLISTIAIIAFLVTLFVSVTLYYKLKNRIINQILYFMMIIEAFFFLVGQNLIILAIAITCLAFLMYPVIFFLDKFLEFIKHFAHYLATTFRWLVEKISMIFFSIVEWVKLHLKLVLTVIGGGCGIGMYFLLYDVFISGLVFLAVYFWVSPEREKETSQTNFGKKLLYRLLIFICLFGTMFTNKIIPLQAWIFTLILLAFFGYVIWAVRKSEEIYNLSMHWRLWSSVL
ncbi:MAG: hypothetical protein ACTSWC_12125, partial [Promethearchaeota archaeon]